MLKWFKPSPVSRSEILRLHTKLYMNLKGLETELEGTANSMQMALQNQSRQETLEKYPEQESVIKRKIEDYTRYGRPTENLQKALKKLEDEREKAQKGPISVVRTRRHAPKQFKEDNTPLAKELHRLLVTCVSQYTGEHKSEAEALLAKIEAKKDGEFRSYVDALVNHVEKILELTDPATQKKLDATAPVSPKVPASNTSRQNKPH